MDILKNIKKCLSGVLLLALLCSSCATDETSKENSSSLQSGTFSEITENSDFSEASEDFESSEGTESAESSEASVVESGEDGSEAVESSADVESSEIIESSAVVESSEDVTEKPSEDVFEVVSKPEESSEDSSFEDYYIFDIPEEYKELDSYKALESMSAGISNTVYIEMSAKTKYMNQDITLTIKSWEDARTGAFLSDTIYESFGTVVNSQKELTVDGVKYIINDSEKTYCVVPESEYTDVDELLKLGTIDRVETKNELVGMEIYSSDWFILSNGSRFGMYTKNGKLKYICIVRTVFGMTSELLFEIKIRDDNSGVKFSIPEGYTLVEYAF